MDMIYMIIKLNLRKLKLSKRLIKNLITSVVQGFLPIKQLILKNILNTALKIYFPNLKKTLTFETPNYKVRVGNFEKKINADIKLEEIKKKYKSAFVLQPENL